MGYLRRLRLRRSEVRAKQRAKDFVAVAVAQNEPEAEMIAGILHGENIPSLIRRTGGFDVPDFLAAGAREILVRPEDEANARAALNQLPPTTRA